MLALYGFCFFFHLILFNVIPFGSFVLDICLFLASMESFQVSWLASSK